MLCALTCRFLARLIKSSLNSSISFLSSRSPFNSFNFKFTKNQITFWSKSELWAIMFSFCQPMKAYPGTQPIDNSQRPYVSYYGDRLPLILLSLLSMLFTFSWQSKCSISSYFCKSWNFTTVVIKLKSG